MLSPCFRLPSRQRLARALSPCMLNGHESDSSHDVSDLLSIINTHDLLSPLNAVEALYLHLPVGVDDEPSPDGSGILSEGSNVNPTRPVIPSSRSSNDSNQIPQKSV